MIPYWIDYRGYKINIYSTTSSTGNLWVCGIVYWCNRSMDTYTSLTSDVNINTFVERIKRKIDDGLDKGEEGVG